MKDSEYIESLTQAKFAEFINTQFSVRGGEAEEVELELVEVSELKVRQPQQEEFSIVFRGPKEKLMSQSIRLLSHEQFGQFELFLVPIRQDANGIYYEAIFNRLRRQAD